MNTETNKQYQEWEIKSFLNQKGFFDTVKEFDATLNDKEWLLEQLEWIENGSYGAGACFYMQRVLKNVTPRMNKTAHIGQAFLHALYGQPFKYWGKLSKQSRESLTWAVEEWLKQDREFAQELED